MEKPIRTVLSTIGITLFLAFLGPEIKAQDWSETAKIQIGLVLDKSTNLVLINEVVTELGDEGKRALIEMAGDEDQPPNHRFSAIRLIGEHRSYAGEKLLFGMLNDPKTICAAVNALKNYRNPELVPAFIPLLDDQRKCGTLSRFRIGGNEKEDETDIHLSDEIVSALEQITGNQLGKEKDLFIIHHRATQPWKDWWAENQNAYLSLPSPFIAPESDSKELENHYPCSVGTIAVSPDGKSAYSVGKSYDPWIRAWNIESRQQIWATPGFRDTDTSDTRVSPDGLTVAMGTVTGEVKLFDAATGRRIRRIIVGSSVNAIAFNPEDTLLALSSDDEVLRFIDTKSWDEIKRIKCPDFVTGISFSPDGSWLATATFEYVRIWDVSTGAELKALKVQTASSPTVFADEGERRAELWKMAWRVAFSPDGKLLASGSSAAIQIWNPATGVEISATPSKGEVSSLHFSPDGKWVIWGNDRDEIRMWNPTTNKKQRIKNEFSPGDSALTPDGKFLLSPGASTEIAIFDLDKRSKVGVLACTK